MKTIKEIFKKYLNETILLLERKGFPSDSEIASCPSIYKIVRSTEKDSFITTGFNKALCADSRKNGQGRGTAAGEGIYSSLKIGGHTGASRLAGYHYGDVLIQGKILGGFERFIMFNGETYPEIRYMIERYYGRKKDGTIYTPYEQCMMITNDKEISDIIQREGTSANCEKRWYGGDDKVKKLRRAGIRGFLYSFQGGPTALPFDWGSVIPYAYAENVYCVEDENSIKRRMKSCYPNYVNSKGEMIYTKEVYENMCDWTFQLDGFYDSYDKESIKEFNGESYCSVYLHNKGWNIVQIDRTNYSNPKAKEILPVWLPEKPDKVSNDGTFDFKYSGIYWQGAISLPDCNTPCLWFPENISEFNEIANVNYSDDWINFTYENLMGVLNSLKSQRLVDENKIKEIFRKNLLKESFNFNNESDFLNGQQRIVYVCTHESNVEGIFANGFSRQFTRDNDNAAFYGDGVYGCFELGNPNTNIRNTGAVYLSYHPGHKHPDGFKYGPIIIKCVLLHGFSRFLLFDENLAKRYYGQNWNIPNQVISIASKDFPQETQTLVNDINYITNHPKWNSDASNFFNCHKNDYGGNTLRTTGLLHEFFDDGARATNKGERFIKYTNLFRKLNIRGAAYHGGNDGPAFVCWHYDEVIPIEVSYNHGKTFSRYDKNGRDLFNFDAIKERLLRDNDPVQKFGHLFAEVSDKPILCNINGKKIPVTIVKTKRGGFNIVLTNTKNGKTISPYDFDEPPIIGSDGIFYFKFNNKTFSGIINLPQDNIPAIWFPENISLINDEPNINSSNDWVEFNYLPSIVQQL